jgi:hypothetical protein
MHFHSTPKYVNLVEDFKPLPKYGHYSEIHPEFAKVEDDIRKGFAAPWAAAESWPQLRELAGYADAMIPPGGPDRERDIVTELLKFPARDGHMLELKVYRSPKVQKDATLVYRMHGGGESVIKNCSKCPLTEDRHGGWDPRDGWRRKRIRRSKSQRCLCEH